MSNILGISKALLINVKEDKRWTFRLTTPTRLPVITPDFNDGQNIPVESYDRESWAN
jgi:hypothetical protein